MQELLDLLTPES
jgi:hypothetical protein